MAYTIDMFCAAFGTNGGSGSNGVLHGTLTNTAAFKALLKTATSAPKCYTEDAGLYVDRTTEAGEATGDDVELLPAVPVVHDAIYFGHASEVPTSILIEGTTQGSWTGTLAWEYFNGTAWAAVSGLSDGTTGFEAANGTQVVAFTAPTDSVAIPIENVVAHYIRARVATYSAIVTRPLAGQAWVTTASGTWTDDTTDFNDAGAGDVALLPVLAVVGDGFYVGHETEKFCKLLVTTSQAITGTNTVALQYWDGSAWTAVTGEEDKSAGWATGAAAQEISFEPPSDWTLNTAGNGPNGQVGYYVRMQMTAKTTYTQQPLATIGYVCPLSTGADGIRVPTTGTVDFVDFTAQTASATNNDSIFMLLNVTAGTWETFTITGADVAEQADLDLAVTANDKLVLIQLQEDGTTEFASATFVFKVT